MAYDPDLMRKSLQLWAKQQVARGEHGSIAAGDGNFRWASTLLSDPAALDTAVQSIVSGKTPKGSTSPEDWLKNAPGIIAAYQTAESMKAQGQDYFKGQLDDLPGAAEANAASQAEQGRISAEEAMRRFSDAMMKPPDMNDPYVQQITKNAAGAAQADASARGIGGGYAVGNTEQAVINAQTGIQQQRSAMGLQALQGAGQLNMQQAQMNLDLYDRQYQAQMAQMAAEQGQAQGLGSAIGTAVGAIGGYYLGGAQGAQAGMQAGGRFGAGIGGMGAYKPPPAYTPYASSSGGKQAGSNPYRPYRGPV